MERKIVLKSEMLLFLTAAIWGFAFVAQRAGMQYVGPFTFNAVRFAIGSIVLVPFILRNRRNQLVKDINCEKKQFQQILYPAGIAGIILFIAISFQQIGIVYTTAGKAGFITGLYVIIVPILGIIWHQHPGVRTWFGAILAVTGLYLLCITGKFEVLRGDLLVFLSAFFWAGHVLFIGHYSSKIYPVLLACLQFAVCSLLSFAAAIMTELINLNGIIDGIIPILYAGLLSTGVAYTLQVVAQRVVPAANASIIMSLESVFAALGGWLILNESLQYRGLLGCCLILTGMIIVQLDPKHYDT
ncbi:MAG: hypothetical protein A2161_04455 [Candidatus Schekmanbacteria bacterium RBG_13_48_7]|uniref:EamA domain-containing protein n=1 Tax=Candidatus Schekmanbacteria bacterium RBG_13_48_7 TaxID=1817878 RepID=A0A1F7RW75_9BACT|nr:MAG: hypothetical protein A2161_04455 [Candidatus Schekmanbacteria bacterium RBG_13_48_7]